MNVSYHLENRLHHSILLGLYTAAIDSVLRERHLHTCTQVPLVTCKSTGRRRKPQLRMNGKPTVLKMSMTVYSE